MDVYSQREVVINISLRHLKVWVYIPVSVNWKFFVRGCARYSRDVF